MEFNEHKPIYLQTADMMQEKILCDTWAEEARIPSVRELGATLGVNPNTIVRSYQLLESKEIIYNKRGIGYFVAPRAVERIKQLRKELFLTEELPEFFGSISTLEISIEEIEKLYKDWREREA